MISVGGYRFMLAELQETVDRTGCGSASVAVLPDALTGHRLTASATNRDATQVALRSGGANPLLVGAFAVRHQASGIRNQNNPK